MCSPLRPWRDHDRSNTLTDRAVVEYVRDCGPARPRDIARSRFRENVIRLQCRYLCACGILTDVARETFVFSPSDQTAVLSRFEPDGFLDLSVSIDDDVRRITDLSEFDARLLRQINRDFLEDDTFTYGYVRGDRRRTERQLANVERYEIDRVLREFPRTESLFRQCAHWVRAITGLHFFPDANHRTAMSSLYTILSATGHETVADRLDFDWIGLAVSRSKLLRRYHCEVNFSTLWERDELFHHWHRYLTNTLADVDARSRNTVPNGFLDDVLDYSRQAREDW